MAGGRQPWQRRPSSRAGLKGLEGLHGGTDGGQVVPASHNHRHVHMTPTLERGSGMGGIHGGHHVCVAMLKSSGTASPRDPKIYKEHVRRPSASSLPPRKPRLLPPRVRRLSSNKAQ